jgi:transcription initiation factor TFIIF subunit beta
MLLRSDLAAHQGIAKEYDFESMEEGKVAKNTFVFTEQDLPGYKSKSRQKFEASTANMPARLQRAKAERNKAPYDPSKKFTPFVKKPVPSRLDDSES